ncbi:MAG: Ornithine cyclodeaminase [Microbacteriaceae bacterium]|nr:Ornithine cyclodeaminase [Microbacteriaceae bacterium]
MSGARPVLLLNRSEVNSLLEWPSLLGATQQALVDLAGGDSLPSVASQLVIPGAALHLKSGALKSPPVISVKANLRPDSGSTSGAILVFDHEAQVLTTVMSSGDLTAMRTAAIAAVAARALVGPDRVSVALVGAGPVARKVAEALEYLEIPSEVRVWSRSRASADALLESTGESDIEYRVFDDVDDAIRGAELIVSCTPARSPMIRSESLAPGAVILAMGADTAGKRELDAGVLESATIYADVREDALKVGESAYLAEGESSRVENIGNLFLSNPVEPASGNRIVFDSVGSSAVDAAVVALVLAGAAEKGLGRTVDLD